MRAHAHVEQHIQRLKDSGLCRFPFTSFEANTNWMMAVAMAADLVRWFQLLCFDGPWVNARPKALRWGHLPRSGPPRAPVETARRAHHRRLARHRRAARRLPAHRPHHLSDLQLPPVGTSLTTRAPKHLPGHLRPRKCARMSALALWRRPKSPTNCAQAARIHELRPVRRTLVNGSG